MRKLVIFVVYLGSTFAAGLIAMHFMRIWNEQKPNVMTSASEYLIPVKFLSPSKKIECFLWGEVNIFGSSSISIYPRMQLDVRKIELLNSPKNTRGEPLAFDGEERFWRTRLQSGKKQLGAEVFFSLWEHKDKIPESWKKKYTNEYVHSTSGYVITFEDTRFIDKHGKRFVVGMWWEERGGVNEWRWACIPMYDLGRDHVLSAVIDPKLVF